MKLERLSAGERCLGGGVFRKFSYCFSGSNLLKCELDDDFVSSFTTSRIVSLISLLLLQLLKASINGFCNLCTNVYFKEGDFLFFKEF